MTAAADIQPDIRVGSPQPSRHDLETGIVHESELKSRNPLFRLLRKAFDHGVEARGIEVSACLATANLSVFPKTSGRVSPGTP